MLRFGAVAAGTSGRVGLPGALATHGVGLHHSATLILRFFPLVSFFSWFFSGPFLSTTNVLDSPARMASGLCPYAISTHYAPCPTRIGHISRDGRPGIDRHTGGPQTLQVNGWSATSDERGSAPGRVRRLYSCGGGGGPASAGLDRAATAGATAVFPGAGDSDPERRGSNGRVIAAATSDVLERVIHVIHVAVQVCANCRVFVCVCVCLCVCVGWCASLLSSRLLHHGRIGPALASRQ